MVIRRVLVSLGLAVLAVVVTPGAALAVSQPPVYPVTCPLQGQTCNTPLNYHGGTIQHHLRIFIVYWGSCWKSDPNRGTYGPVVTGCRAKQPGRHSP